MVCVSVNCVLKWRVEKKNQWNGKHEKHCETHLPPLFYSGDFLDPQHILHLSFDLCTWPLTLAASAALLVWPRAESTARVLWRSRPPRGRRAQHSAQRAAAGSKSHWKNPFQPDVVALLFFFVLLEWVGSGFLRFNDQFWIVWNGLKPPATWRVSTGSGGSMARKKGGWTVHSHCSPWHVLVLSLTTGGFYWVFNSWDAVSLAPCLHGARKGRMPGRSWAQASSI